MSAETSCRAIRDSNMAMGKQCVDSISRYTPMDELIARHPEIIPVINRNGMYCVGCLLAAFHDLRDAAVEHDLDEDSLFEEIIEVVDAHDKKRTT